MTAIECNTKRKMLVVVVVVVEPTTTITKPRGQHFFSLLLLLPPVLLTISYGTRTGRNWKAECDKAFVVNCCRLWMEYGVNIFGWHHPSPRKQGHPSIRIWLFRHVRRNLDVSK